jgi:DNA (cytosine-5)-methyltransferase 1
MKTLTIGSLFSGIGGLELGLERAGMKTVWQVEQDPYAQKVLEKHWPGVLRWGDVRTATAATLGPVDLICGGFPCQDISNAGGRAGIDGERSGLWSEFHRLIRELRPRYVLVENVAALLVRGLDRVLGDLAASGFDAEWDCIPAAAVGAPHRRDRLFVVAYTQRVPVREQPESEPGRGGAPVAQRDGSNGILAHTQSERRGGKGGLGAGGSRKLEPAHTQAIPTNAHGLGLEESWNPGLPRIFGPPSPASDGGGWATEPDVGRVAHGVSARVDRLRCLGNAVVPRVAEFVGRRILAREATLR